MRMPLSPVEARTSSTQRGPVLTVAHRGASAYAPENTLAAVRCAVGHHADLVELDVQRSKDGALVLLHDTTLARTTNVRRLFPGRRPWLVSDFTYAEIRRLDAGSWRSDRFVGETVPTLTEAIEAVRTSGTGLLLELKAPALYPGIVADLASTLRQVPAYLEAATTANRLIVESFDHGAMHDHKSLEPSVPVGLLGAPDTARLARLAAWADQVNPGHWTTDAAYVAAVRDAGMACLVWTVNRAAAMRRALRLGVDGVITDRPDLLRRQVAAHPAAAGHASATKMQNGWPAGSAKTYSGSSSSSDRSSRTVAPSDVARSR